MPEGVIMANHLSFSKKSLVLSSLVEGNSIRSVERITGVHRDTIMRLLVSTGEKAWEIHNDLMIDLKLKKIQADEIWCYVAKKQGHLKPKEKRNSKIGDQYVFVALDADTKLVPTYCVGKRCHELTHQFIKELSTRIKCRFQLSTDGYHGYYTAVDDLFGNDIDYAQIVKYYGYEYNKEERRYSPPKIIGIDITPLIGKPIHVHISTSFVERQNLTMRTNIRRLTRLTNAFSKKLENLKAAISLHFFYYNFMRIHKSLRVTPAMEAGITKTIWTWENLLTYSH